MKLGLAKIKYLLIFLKKFQTLNIYFVFVMICEVIAGFVWWHYKYISLYGYAQMCSSSMVLVLFSSCCLLSNIQQPLRMLVLNTSIWPSVSLKLDQQTKISTKFWTNICLESGETLNEGLLGNDREDIKYYETVRNSKKLTNTQIHNNK